MFHPVELILALLVVGVVLALIARKLRIPEPILLVIGGLILGLQPWTPSITLDPQVVFLLFLPPLLYAAAFRTPWPDFREQIRPILLLAIGLVLFTTAVVAIVAHYYIGLPWAAAVVLGAIISPPDAVAAISVTQKLRVHKYITTILEGESLVNDASALVTLRVAQIAVVTGTFSLLDAGLQFLLVNIGGILIGIAGGWVVIRLHTWIERTKLSDSRLTITVTLLTPYAFYLLAEHLHLSGVLAAVAGGLWVGNRCELVFSCDLFDEAHAVWSWVESLLNILIFILVGLTLRNILDDIGYGHTIEEILVDSAVVLAVVIVARLVWMFPGAYLPRWLDRKLLGIPSPYPPWQNVTVIAWTGMRGVVSLAAAMSLPLTTADGTPFPGRNLIQFLAFAVIFGTLVGQGLTLPVVIRFLGMPKPPDDSDSPEPPNDEISDDTALASTHSPD